MTIVTHRGFRVAVADDALGAAFAPTGVLAHDVPRHVDVGGTAGRAVVEYYRAVGGLPQRATLGGVWEPNASGLLRVEVAHTEPVLDGPRPWVGELGHPLVPGLPGEYASVVLDVLRHSTLPSGNLIVDRAAHDPVESSELAFRAVTLLLLAALGAPRGGVLGAVEAQLARLGADGVPARKPTDGS